MKKLYTDEQYYETVIQANKQHQIVEKYQDSIEYDIDVYEYKKKTIKVPVLDPETGEPTGKTESIQVDDLTKPIMIEDVDEEGNTIQIHKSHKQPVTEIVEKIRIIDNPNNRQLLDGLSLTPADVERALYQAKQMDFNDLKTLIGKKIPQLDMKQLAIEFRANKFYRGVEVGGQRLIDVVGALLGYTSDDMDYLFKHKQLPTVDNGNVDGGE